MKKKLLLLLGVFSIIITDGQDTIRYSIVSAGLIKGFLKSWQNTNGTITDWYQYNDRGRGDSIVSNYKTDEQGFPVQLHSGGVDYLKNPVEETFNFLNGKAVWKNNAEKEERLTGWPAFYIPLKGTGGNLYKALLSNNNTIKLLPYGEATLETIQKHTIGTGTMAKRVELMRISGMGLTPSYTWIDEDKREFANVNNWFSSIRQGYESYIKELLAIQQKWEAGYYNRLAARLTIHTKEVLIKKIRLFDAIKAEVVNDADILIQDGIIKQIAVGKRINAPAAKVIDGNGKTILPGLWDMHVHFSSDIDGLLHMAAGVTHVRDMGNDSSLFIRQQKISKGTLIGPDINIMSGFIDGAGPLAAPTGTLINTQQEGVRAIRAYAKKGYQQIKLYSSIKPEWVQPLAAEAHKHNMRVAGHIPAFMTAEQAIAAGYDEITHMNMLALNFWGDTVDTRSPNRFLLPAQRTAGLNINGEAMKKFLALLKTRNIAVDPTINVFETMFTAKDGQMEERFESVVDRLPVIMQRNIRAGGGGLPATDQMKETYLKSFEVFLQITRLLYENNIRIVAGTDGFAGFDLHRELELYVRAGIPTARVLQIATHGTAVYIEKQKQFGSIAPGRKADFVIVEGNPVDTISHIRNTRWVIKGNALYDTKELYKAISIGAN